MESKSYRKASADEKREIEKRQAFVEEMRYRGASWAEALGDDLVVTKIHPGGPAERAGLSLGDQLTKIGGIPVGGQTSPEELTGMLTGVPGSKVLVTLRRNNEEKQIVITREVIPDRGR
jgi:C-terminal processing protease CtpA/Prc